MEINTKFSTRMEEGKVVVVQEVARIMTPEESILEFQGLQGQIKKAEADKQQLSNAIQQKKLESDLEKIQKNLEELQPLHKEWEELNKPLHEEIKVKLKREIRKEKAKRGYERVEDTNQRIVLQNQILGPIAAEHNLQMSHLVIHELKKEFDQI